MIFDACIQADVHIYNNYDSAMSYILGRYMKFRLRYTCITHRLASEVCDIPEMVACPERSSALLSLDQESWLGRGRIRASGSIEFVYIYIYAYPLIYK